MLITLKVYNKDTIVVSIDDNLVSLLLILNLLIKAFSTLYISMTVLKEQALIFNFNSSQTSTMEIFVKIVND